MNSRLRAGIAIAVISIGACVIWYMASGYARPAELRRQGFSREDQGSAPGQERKAVRRESAFPCSDSALIFRRTDGEGRLTAIRGIYFQGACL